MKCFETYFCIRKKPTGMSTKNEMCFIFSEVSMKERHLTFILLKVYFQRSYLCIESSYFVSLEFDAGTNLSIAAKSGI